MCLPPPLALHRPNSCSFFFPTVVSGVHRHDWCMLCAPREMTANLVRLHRNKSRVEQSWREDVPQNHFNPLRTMKEGPKTCRQIIPGHNFSWGATSRGILKERRSLTKAERAWINRYIGANITLGNSGIPGMCLRTCRDCKSRLRHQHSPTEAAF